MTSDNLEELYRIRFSEKERRVRERVWRVLCEDFFQQFVRETDTVVDIAAGFGEFLRYIRAGRKIAVDINPSVQGALPRDVEFICTSAQSMAEIGDGTVDVCFVSNFFEHLPNKTAMDEVLRESYRILKPGGRFISMQPNIRYVGARYWDFYDHVLPLSHSSAVEGFQKNGFFIEKLIARFVPYTTKCAIPKHPLFVRAYLRMPVLWRFIGGQFVLVAQRRDVRGLNPDLSEVQYESPKNMDSRKCIMEKAVLYLLGLSLFIGIWYALPMLSAIGDEFFVGSVLRAMEHHTIIPAVGDVLYGTITYFLNYILIGIALVFALPFFRFDVAALKMFLLQSPEYAYIIPRLLNACLALAMLLIFNRFFKKVINDAKARLFLLVLLFTNMITTVIFHTGKMWVLSTLLVIVSFMYLYDALEKGADDARRADRSIFFTILFSFLALANFPLSMYSLINLPILLYFFRKDRQSCLVIGKSFLIGVLVFFLVTAMNFESIKAQVLSVPDDLHTFGIATRFDAVAPFKSMISNFYKLLLLFPLTLITLLASFGNNIRNKKLFVLSLIYFFVYFVMISLVANGAYLGITDKLRYLLHLGFFLTLIIASFDLHFNKLMYVIGGISLVYYIFTIFLLSVPTTYNQASAWIKQTYGDQDVVIVNKAVVYLELPKNKESYAIMKEEYCSTKCLNIIKYDLNSDFKPLTIDEKSLATINVMELARDRDLYIIESAATSSKEMQLVEFFGNRIDDALYYSVDSNMGNYLDLNYFKIKNLGNNIYIYKYQRGT
jgi:SAM-dependent methyltransferase